MTLQSKNGPHAGEEEPAGGDALAIWQEVCGDGGRALRTAAAASDPGRAADVARLRREWPAEQVSMALELAAARAKARDKYPALPQVVGDVAGVEQGTSAWVASHKSARVVQSGIAEVHDYCCGIGGDAMALSEVARVTAVDSDPVRAWMCQQNIAFASGSCAASSTVEVADVTTLDRGGVAVHIDPSRREESGQRRRAWRYQDYRPDPAFLAQLVQQQRAVAIKLGPGVDFTELPAPSETELELISDEGSLVQAVLWSGAFVSNPGTRSATIVRRDGTTETLRGWPVELATSAPSDPVSAWVFEPDPALERAGLLGLLAGDHALVEIAPGLGLLTGANRVVTPWCTPFEVVEVMPWREKRVRSWLSSHDAGIVEVKTRGGAAQANALQKALRGRGATPWTLFVLRLGQKKVAVVTRRLNELRSGEQ